MLPEPDPTYYIRVPLGVTMLDELEARTGKPDPRVFRVGLVLPMRGILGQVGPSALEAAILAAGEIRHTRPHSDRPLELVLTDSGRAPDEVAGSVRALACGRLVEAFVGLHTSDTLQAIERGLGRTRVPYVFTPGHEDDERAVGFHCSGESAHQQTRDLSRVIADRGVREWAIVGTDYVWPRAMGAAARAQIGAHGGRVVLDRLVPVGSLARTAAGLARELAGSGARGVMVNLPGRDLTEMLLGIRRAGLDDRIVRYSGALEENALYAIGGDRSGNLYSSLHSFENLDSPRRRELNQRYARAFGDASPVLNSWAEHCYDAVHLLAGLESAGRLSPDDLIPGSPALDLRPRNQTHLAVAEGMRFAVL